MSKEAVNSILGLCTEHGVIDDAVLEADLHVSGLHPWRDNVELTFHETDTDLPNPIAGTVIDAFDGETCEPQNYQVLGCEVITETPCYLRTATEGTVPDTVADSYAAAMGALAVYRDYAQALELLQEFLIELDENIRRDQITLPTNYEFRTAYLVGKIRPKCEKCVAPETVVVPDPLVVVFTHGAVTATFYAFETTLTPVVTGGTAPYTYLWAADAGATFNNNTFESPILTLQPDDDEPIPASVTVTVTDSLAEIAQFTLIVPDETA